jgi:formylglycine-generating enzyme required for sulfatase activity
MSMWTPAWRGGASFGAAQLHSTDKHGIRWLMLPAGTIDVFSPKHQRMVPISLPTPLLMSETPITQAQFLRVMGQGDFAFLGADHPADSVVYGAADAFCERVGARVPNEREWIYGTLAGADPSWVRLGTYGAVNEIAWYAENSGGSTHPVGTKRPTAFGLYDMLGNVAQWTSSSDDVGRTRRVYGASFASPEAMVSVTNFFALPHRTSNPSVGFRCVKNYFPPPRSRTQMLEMDEMAPAPAGPMASERETSKRVTSLELDGLRDRRYRGARRRR